MQVTVVLFNHWRVSMVIVDGLVPLSHQDICNHHHDMCNLRANKNHPMQNICHIKVNSINPIDEFMRLGNSESSGVQWIGSMPIPRKTSTSTYTNYWRSRDGSLHLGRLYPTLITHEPGIFSFGTFFIEDSCVRGRQAAMTCDPVYV